MEARLARVPTAVELQVERSHLLADLERTPEAAQAYRAALKSGTPRYPLTTRAYSILPYTGNALPITALLLVPPAWGNAPFRRHLDSQTFLTLQIITDFHDPELALPPHQVVINCISDADWCESSLQAASALLATTKAPVVNAPAEVSGTARESNARRLASIPGLRTPKIATLSRKVLAGNEAVKTLEEQGFSFPLLLRSPGFHTGLHFVRVENAQELSAALTDLPGDSLSVIEYLDARAADGNIRKYRVMVIDGIFYPAHVAISQDWKVHYFSAAMAEFPEHRAEDQDFLENMARILGGRAMETLQRLHEVMKLDYWGIDFSLGVDGEILLFEANATMNIQLPEQDEMWAYRRDAVQQITGAVRGMFIKRALSWRDPATPAALQILQEVALRQIGADDPGQIALNIARARRLVEMERFDEAKDIYLGILIQDPMHLVALNNLAALFNMMGYHQSALKVYREVVKLEPENPKGRLNFAHTLREAGELTEARGHYEAVLRLVPDQPEAHRGLSYVLMYQRETEAAWAHQKKWAATRAKTIAPSRSEKNVILTFASPCGGNSPILRLLDKKMFQFSGIIPDFYDRSVPLPPHQLVINAVGDADNCGTSLDATEQILGQATQPVLNAPARIRLTGRAENACLLGTLEDVVTAKIVPLSREILTGPDAIPILESHGFTFPVLFRTPGFHEGSYFQRVENPDTLAATIERLPGKELLAIQYLDARDGDGKIRKYRVMMIDGKLHPLHKAVSQGWMIHYYSAEMAHSPEHRIEDAAFLEDMPSVLGPRAMRALGRINDALGLEYAGADFSLGPNGEVLLFEANATMAVPDPDRGAQWDYRRSPVQKIQTAVQDMIRSRAGIS